jgi:multicomponent Na+:H+ antiporter subunit B
MKRKTRLRFFLICGLVLTAVFVAGVRNVPPVGQYRGPYGDVVNALSVPERHVTDAVTLVNFDVRGFDTLGEEYILFTSVMAVVLLLRIQRDEPRHRQSDHATDRQAIAMSDAVRVVSLILTALIALFGIYVVTHGQLTPGGGFQGGVILATGPLLLYLAGEFENFRKAVPRRLVHAAEALGAGGYALIGLGCMAAGGLFLQNILPLGSTGSIISGGTIPIIDFSVGLEVTGGMALVLVVYLEETLERKEE